MRDRQAFPPTGTARMHPDDLTLFHLGDPTFLRTQYAKHRSKLLACARQYLDDPDDADDAIAETWGLAWDKRDHFRGDGMLEHWLLKICSTVCLDRLRSRKKEARLLHDVAQDEPAYVDWRVAEEAARLMQDMTDAVYEAIVALPPRQRNTVVLRLLLNKRTAEVAEYMHCAPGTVKANLHKAMKHLAPQTQKALGMLVAAREAIASGTPDNCL